MANYTVCVSDKRHASYEVEQELLRTIGVELKLCNCVTEEDIVEQCGDADAILLDLAPMTAKAIAGLKHCKIISRYGEPLDTIYNVVE